MGLSRSWSSLRILLTLIGVILVTSGSADAIIAPPFPPETLENPVGGITNDNLKEAVTEHPVTSSTTEVPKTSPSLPPATTTELSVVAEAHSVTPPTTENPITTTTQTTATDKSIEPVTVHLLNATSVPPNQPIPTHILDKLQDHHDNIVTAESHTPPPNTPPVTASPIIFPQHTPQGLVTHTPLSKVKVTTPTSATPSQLPTTVSPVVTTAPSIVPAPTLTTTPPPTFTPTISTPKPPIALPLFPPVQPNPLALFGNLYTGLMVATSAFINSIPNPFRRDPEPPTPSNTFLNSVNLAMATPFVFIGAKLGAPLVIISSTLAIPVVKAGGFFTIPFVKSKNDKESVPLFVVTDSVNSFAMQIDAPDIKPTIEAGQLIIVARTPAAEKLLDPLLNALKGVNSGVQEQTIILQPVLKAQTLDNNATPSDLAQVVRDVRKILNLQTVSDHVTDAVENIKSSVNRARDSVHQTIKSGIINIFGSDSDDSTDKKRVPQSAPQMDSNTDDSIPIIWVTPAPDTRPTPATPVVTPHPNIPLVDEVHYENGAPRRNKRDVSSYPEIIDVIEVSTKQPITKKPYVQQSATVPTVKYSQTVKPATQYRPLEDQIPKDITPERLLDCSAVLIEMSTTECHRIENYTLKSCRTDPLACKNVAQQDLTRLMGLCNKPEADFMCNMKSLEQRQNEIVDGKTTTKICQTYSFKIVRIFDTKSPLCHDQLKCVFGKQFGCHSKMP